MEDTAGRVVLHASRAKASLVALLCGGILAFILPVISPILSLLIASPGLILSVPLSIFPLLFLLMMGLFTPLYLYWTFTSLPLITVDTSEVVYQRYPFVMRRILWADIDRVDAVNRPMYYPYKYTRLTVWFDIAPDAQAAYQDKSPVKLTTFIAGLTLLPVSADEFVALLRRYHEVSYGT